MENASEDRRAAAVAAMEANRFAEVYRLWLPLAEIGDAEAQGHVGSLMQCGLHRFESLEQLDAAAGSATDAATAAADREQAGWYLQAASAAGIGPASFNLATLYVGGYGGGTWEERKAKAAELYARAYAQGFTAFGWLMHGSGPGQPYLDAMEKFLIEGDQSPPPEWWRAEPGTCSNPTGG
ncbi:hypothetical protein [Fimbriiglobus ruber]|uniref:Sel1 repeat family protein n=1 Tax=Fimbriiglobus ruber TaxID=1908690 RepID=A0A225DVD9_9BACT|nr:hypothetical protein [Fimbriiglobus ruber]OWK44953.1 hypothetical protein FRUB_01284 [Fimbriiglobus ruber]